jgi:hypothetical protein
LLGCEWAANSAAAQITATEEENLKTLAAIISVLLLFITIQAQQPQPPAAQPGTFEARVEEFLQQSGYTFQKVKANSWFLLVDGKEMGQIRIILGAGPRQIAMGAVVVPKRKLQLSTEGLQKLMKLSYELNYVRVCLDGDDDLIVLQQMKEPWLNAEEFKTTVNTVANAADRAYAEIRPYIANSK